MCIGLIRGVGKLARHSMKEAERFDIELKVFNKFESNLSKKINRLDALIIFWDKVSHNAKKEAMNVARGRRIPILIYHRNISSKRDMHITERFEFYCKRKERKMNR